jgi:hypothetical protein
MAEWKSWRGISVILARVMFLVEVLALSCLHDFSATGGRIKTRINLVRVRSVLKQSPTLVLAPQGLICTSAYSTPSLITLMHPVGLTM